MNDAVGIARLQDACTILGRAALDFEDEKVRSAALTARDVCRDALDAQANAEKLAQTRQHLEVLADALAAPGGEA